MLQKTVFQDNIYQLSRSIDVLHEGLMLELSGEYFFDKTVDDILFIDASIQKLLKQLQANSHTTGFNALLHSLHSCLNRYLLTIDLILSGKGCMADQFAPLSPKLKDIRINIAAIRENLAKDIQKTDTSGDATDIVSSNELSELLNF
jgi:hypothetical protein